MSTQASTGRRRPDSKTLILERLHLGMKELNESKDPETGRIPTVGIHKARHQFEEALRILRDVQIWQRGLISEAANRLRR